MKTESITREQADRKWFVVDMKDKVLGRAASKIAAILKGKMKPTYTANADTGDFVIALNVDKLIFTGNKMQTKIYRHHTGYLGGLKITTAEKMMKSKPTEVLRKAVWGMLPKTSLGRRLITKLKLYTGSNHPHQAQKPVVFDLDTLKIQG
jgi:large subunit ribosomal protein L13